MMSQSVAAALAESSACTTQPQRCNSAEVASSTLGSSSTRHTPAAIEQPGLRIARMPALRRNAATFGKPYKPDTGAAPKRERNTTSTPINCPRRLTIAAQADAFHVLVARLAHPIKLLEHLRQMLLGNAVARS
jgi:hypothetical protein